MRKFLKAIRTELSILKRFVKNYGHFKTVLQLQSIDKNGNPLPWYTYPAIEYLTQFDYKDKIIFEWGSGNSSLFWANIAKEVYSVEDNKDWYNKVKERKLNNMKLFLINNKDKYINIIGSFNIKFDIIIIDAKYRQECADIAYKYLNDNGMLIFDNSDRYPKTCNKIKENFNLIQVDFSGFGPIVGFTTTTSIFLKRNFNFKTINYQPIHSIGSLKELCE